jgi:hypothetical protein
LHDGRRLLDQLGYGLDLAVRANVRLRRLSGSLD